MIDLEKALEDLDDVLWLGFFVALVWILLPVQPVIVGTSGVFLLLGFLGWRLWTRPLDPFYCYAPHVVPYYPTGKYLACLPDVPGCFAYGDTPQDAYNALYRAFRDWKFQEGTSPEPLDLPAIWEEAA